MDDLLKTLILEAPNFIGFIVLAVILSRQNAALQKALIDLCNQLQEILQREIKP